MEFITVQDAAAVLRVSPKAVYYAVTEKKLTRHEQFGRVVLDKSEVEAYQPRAGANRSPHKTERQPLSPSASTLTTQAALAGPIAEIWDTPEEDEAWAHLAGLPKTGTVGK